MVIDDGSTMQVQFATKLGPALGEISILHRYSEWGQLYDNRTIEQSYGHVDRCEDPLSSCERLDCGVPHTFRGLKSSQTVDVWILPLRKVYRCFATITLWNHKMVVAELGVHKRRKIAPHDQSG